MNQVLFSSLSSLLQLTLLQCPIGPNTTFHYQFDTAGQTGKQVYYLHSASTGKLTSYSATGTIRISLLSIATVFVVLSLSMVLRTLSVRMTANVHIQDPEDPLKHLYDVDDGMSSSKFTRVQCIDGHIDSTIITLADWYHDLAPEAQNRFFQTGSVP